MNKPCFYSLSTLSYLHQFTTCCAFQKNETSYFIDSVKPSEIFNSNNLRQLRLNLYDGIWPKGCEHCKISEELGVKSSRMDYKFDGKSFENESGNYIFQQFNIIDGTVNLNGLKRVEIRLSNACNMRCLHCSNQYSSKWEKLTNSYIPDADDIFHEITQLNGKKSHVGLTNNQIKDIIEDLNENCPNLERIILSGGEPLFNKSFVKILKLFSLHPNSKNIRLSFHTNLNPGIPIDYDQITHYLSKFKKTEIVVSIDAGQKMYPYFRQNSWENLITNLNLFREINDFSVFETACSFSIFQALDLKNTLIDILNLNFSEFRVGIVKDPLYIHPALVKYNFEKSFFDDVQYVKSYILSYKNGTENLKKSILYYFNNVETNIKNMKIEEKKYKSFLHYVKKVDLLWGKKFNDFFTDYAFNGTKLERINS